MTQADLAAELGVTPRYLGYLENGQKDVDPNSSLYKLFVALDDGAVPVSRHRNTHNGRSHLHEEPAAYHAGPASTKGGLNVTEVLAQIRADLASIETGTASEKRRAYHFLHEVHLPMLAQMLKLN